MMNDIAHTDDGRERHVTPDVAKRMMLLGFDAPCDAKWMLDVRVDTVPGFRYNHPSEARVFKHNSRDTKGLNWKGGEPIIWSAPTYKQALDWFRDEFAIDGIVAPDDKSDGRLKMRNYWITLYSNGNGLVRVTKFREHYIRYESAEKSCVSRCLDMAQGMHRKRNVNNVK